MEKCSLQLKESLLARMDHCIRNTIMRKDVSKDSFKLGVKFGVVTRLREH